MKAAYIYNFAKFVTWPADAFEDSGGKLRVCSIDQGSLGGALAALQNRSAQGKQLEIHYLSGEQNLAQPNCHILYMNGGGDVSAIYGSLEAKPVVLIRELESNTAPSGMIVFRRVDNKLRFDIDLRAAKSKRIDISSFLVKLALNVYD